MTAGGWGGGEKGERERDDLVYLVLIFSAEGNSLLSLLCCGLVLCGAQAGGSLTVGGHPDVSCELTRKEEPMHGAVRFRRPENRSFQQLRSHELQDSEVEFRFDFIVTQLH